MNADTSKLVQTLQIAAFADQSSSRNLAPGQVVALRRRDAARVACVSGWLWITSEADREDHLLGMGESYSVPAQGKLVLSCPQGGAFSLA